MRTLERLRAHYEIEKDLAARLRQAPVADRRHLYAALYDELFRRVPDHPQLQAKASPAARQLEVALQLGLFARFLTPATRFLEIGSGDCALTLAVAPRVHSVWAVDVSDDITRRARVPGNVRLVLSDGISVPVAPGSIDFAYSNQLVEHLHPDVGKRVRDEVDDMASATLAAGHDRDYAMVLLEDCCAAHSAEEHRNSIGSLGRFCQVTTSDPFDFKS